MKKNKTEKVLEKIYQLRTKKNDSNRLFIEQFYIIKEVHNSTLKKKQKIVKK